jgi:cellulose synthase/poly-beta-1,6-N-acetylglucosamine synthase-like glycosyltransferase
VSGVAEAGLPVEIAFLASHGVPPAELQRAALAAVRLGVSPARQVIASGLVGEVAFYRALAAELGLHFLAEAPPLLPGGDLAAIMREGVSRAANGPRSPVRFACAPPAGAPLRRFMAGKPQGRDDLVIVTPSALARGLRASNARMLARRAAGLDEAGLARFSARTGSSISQKGLALLIVGLLAALTTLAPVGTLIGVALALGPVFFGAVVLRLASLMEKPPADLWREHRWRVDDSRLPVYTVAVPLLGEEKVLNQLIGALSALDYPPAKLDVRILVEEIDLGMQRLLAARQLPPFMQIVIVPRGAPQTKPRALNVALAEAQGELFTIFDAEDVPEPQQLRLAAARFLRDDADLVCLQARLVIDNTGDGWLASFFALEYAGLFDVFNPGLLRCGLPIMLGGTSNHFRTEALREVGGWDAWNVTEDADIGFRLVRAGGRIADLPSATLEEAPPNLRVWMKQRTRWLKGYLQTLISHLLAPHRLLLEAGPVATLTFLVLALGTLLGTLGYPFFLLGFTLAVLNGSLLNPDSPLELLLSATALTLTGAGVGVVFLVPALGAWRRGAVDLWRCLPGLPLYYMLVSLAAWLALIEYSNRPFAWNKTEHGRARSSRYRKPPA